MKFLAAVLLGCVTAIGSVQAYAQSPFSAVRLVNSSVITGYDITQRIKLLGALGFRGENISNVALSQLTEDRLKMEAATNFGMALPDDSIDEAIGTFAEQRQMSAGALISTTQRAGVDRETLNEFIRTAVLWRDLVNIRFRSRATPNEADIENVLNFAASSTQESVFIREIAIPFAERGTQGARNLANQIIRDVRNGANFAEFARRFSRTPTASKGGALGWTPANRLPPGLAGQVLSLSRGEVSAPIEVPAGIILIQLADIREISAEENPDVTASYVRLDVPVADANDVNAVATANATAAGLQEDLQGCADAESRISDFGPASGRFGPEPVVSMPESLVQVLDLLDADEVGISPASDAGVSVIVLCNRAATANPEAIENLQTQIFGQRMNSYANSFLQELKADALIIDK